MVATRLWSWGGCKPHFCRSKKQKWFYLSRFTRLVCENVAQSIFCQNLSYPVKN
jgi:hypothetical protein